MRRALQPKPDMVFQMAKRIKLDLTQFGGFTSLKENLQEQPLNDFITILYKKRFSKR
jgi:hypothetical protein